MNGAQSNRRQGASAPELRTSGKSGRQKTTHGLTAMAVDDDPVVLQLAADMLKELGYEVRTAGEGAEALFHFHSSPCGLVLTGYEMPAINGYQLGRKIKSQFPGTLVVVMTGLCRAEVTGLMSDEGIDGWLFKPFCIEELEALLERVGLPGSAAAKSRSIP